MTNEEENKQPDLYFLERVIELAEDVRGIDTYGLAVDLSDIVDKYIKNAVNEYLKAETPAELQKIITYYTKYYEEDWRKMTNEEEIIKAMQELVSDGRERGYNDIADDIEELIKNYTDNLAYKQEMRERYN